MLRLQFVRRSSRVMERPRLEELEAVAPIPRAVVTDASAGGPALLLLLSCVPVGGSKVAQPPTERDELPLPDEETVVSVGSGNARCKGASLTVWSSLVSGAVPNSEAEGQSACVRLL